MKRKTSTTPTKIWSFGALRPTENEKLLLDQLFEANRYYNTLIEIERGRRAQFREARAALVPELAALELEWQRLDESLTSALTALPKRVATAKKTARVATPEILALKAERKVVSGRMKELRAAFKEDADAQAKLTHINDSAQLAVKAAREATPLYWGTYLLIEQQVEQARKSPSDPEFRRFTGSGRIGVQLQGGLTTPELLSGTDTRLQVLAPPAPARSSRRSAHHGYQVRIRVGSAGRAPIWATLPIILHRPLPKAGVIKWAWIKITNVGGRRRYDLQLALESETFREASGGKGVVAINFGWRANDDGSRRVAYAVDNTGHEEILSLPASVESTLDLTDRLRSFRDLHFEEAKRAVMAHLALHSGPEWLLTDTRHIAQWRNPGRLAKIAGRLTEELLTDHHDTLTRWRTERLAEKRDLLDTAPVAIAWCKLKGLPALAFYLELWRRKNRHLREWEMSERDAVNRRRTDLYRNWARRISNTYAEILIENFDLREMAKIPEPDEEQRHRGFRYARAAAAPGEARQKLMTIAQHKIVVGDAKHNTVRCFDCHHINERSLTHQVTCAGCGRSWDQDANNCRNQLRERPGAPPVPVPARRSGNASPSALSEPLGQSGQPQASHVP